MRSDFSVNSSKTKNDHDESVNDYKIELSCAGHEVPPASQIKRFRL